MIALFSFQISQFRIEMSPLM